MLAPYPRAFLRTTHGTGPGRAPARRRGGARLAERPARTAAELFSAATAPLPVSGPGKDQGNMGASVAPLRYHTRVADAEPPPERREEGAMSYPIPDNERARNEALRAYQIMDTPSELAFDEVAELAAQVCGCPIGYISFIEEDRFWFKAQYGLSPDFVGCPREVAFCSVTICGTELVIAPDMTRDERFSHFDTVTGEPYLRFYCSVPLVNPDGYALGTLCVMDFEPRELNFQAQEALRRLARQILGQLELRRKVIEFDHAMRELEETRASAESERARAMELLTNILPQSVAEELKENGRVKPRYFGSATVLFADFCGFTRLAERLEPAALLDLLDQYFTAFDEIIARRGVEKIKTIGDAYMAVGGVPTPTRGHALDAAAAALEMQAFVARMKAQREKIGLPTLDLRVGLHSGPVIAGVVGQGKFTYDVWGDAVNLAARLEAQGEPGRINVSDEVYHQVRGVFEATPRGKIEVKDKRAIQMYFLDGLKPEHASGGGGLQPGERVARERERK